MPWHRYDVCSQQVAPGYHLEIYVNLRPTGRYFQVESVWFVGTEPPRNGLALGRYKMTRQIGDREARPMAGWLPQRVEQGHGTCLCDGDALLFRKNAAPNISCINLSRDGFALRRPKAST